MSTAIARVIVTWHRSLHCARTPNSPHRRVVDTTHHQKST